MKKLLLFLLVMQSAPVIKKTTNCFKNIFLHPLFENEDFLLSYTFEVDKPQFVTFVFSFEYADGSKVVFDSDGHHILNTTTYTTNAKAELIKDNSLLKITASSANFYKTVEFAISTISRTPKKIAALNNVFYKENAIQYLDDTGHVHANDEKITIKHRGIYSSSYPFLDLSSISFVYETYYPYANFEGSKVQIKILDPLNIFPLLSVNGEFLLTFELTKSSNDTYKMNLYDKLYLDPVTYLTSPNPKEGFIKTNRLYLPKNSDNLKLDFYLLISDLGLQRLYATRKIVCNFSDYVGSCSSSKYCVELNESDMHSSENEVKIEL